MTEQEIKKIESSIGYTFHNKALLAQAFTRKSYTIENGGENNEVLEFIGDEVLDYIITLMLLRSSGGVDEKGEYSSMKSESSLTESKKSMVQGKTLANCISNLHLQKYLLLGKGDIKQKVQDKDSVKEDLFEAIIGAIAVDTNYNTELILNSVKLMYSFDDVLYDMDDFVSKVQSWFQRKYSELPPYRYTNNILGQYVCTIMIPDYPIPFIGIGNSKSKARSIVAKEVYRYLENNDLLFTIKDDIKEFDEDNAINQLQELYQKGYISEPTYDFEYVKNAGWKCTVKVESVKKENSITSENKKTAKKYAALGMLKYVSRTVKSK